MEAFKSTIRFPTTFPRRTMLSVVKIFSSSLVAVPAFNDKFKRHIYSTEVRLANPAGRREIP